MKIFNLKPKNKSTSGKKINKDDLYNYSTKDLRENTVQFLYSFSRDKRAVHETYWETMDDYYDGEHDTAKQMAQYINDEGIPWTPPQSTDGFIHVETQIDPTIPDFEFSGRDSFTDGAKAKERELVCRYVIENNDMETMNTRNERWMNKFGFAAWKVAFDANIKVPGFMGDIKVGNPRMTQLFFDPSITEDIDEGEYCILVYRAHKMKVAREFRDELKKLGKTVKDFATGYDMESTEFMKDKNNGDFIDSSFYDSNDETLRIMEFYFRQPEDGEETREVEFGSIPEMKYKKTQITYKWKAGDIGLIILINDDEVRYVPKYWLKTNCNMYPISVYCKVPNDNSIYGKSEIELIKTHIDAVDRELAYAQLNDAFTANDIVLVEENAFADGHTPENKPAAMWVTKDNKIDKVRRLGGLSQFKLPLYEAADKFREMMQQTNGNYDAFQGVEPSKVTTATGLAILNDRAKSRQDIKKPDRNAGFKRLIQLIDYTALEFFDDNRLIYIGAKEKGQQSIQFGFNSDNHRVYDDLSGEYYYPPVDVKINVGDGLKHSKAFTVQAISDLMKTPITPQNYKIVEAYLDLIDIPTRQEIKDFIESTIQQSQQPPAGQGQQQITLDSLLGGLDDAEKEHLLENPDLLAQFMKENGISGGQQ